MTDKLYVWVDGKKYDLTEFSAHHPGGKYVLNEFHDRDATLFYHSTHKNKIIHKAFQPIDIDTSKTKCQQIVNGRNTNTIYTFSTEYRQLVKDVYKLLDNDTYAPVLWYIRAIIIIVSVFVCYYLHTFYFQSFALIVFFRIIHGLTVAFTGLNVLHDASHGSVSRHPVINRVFSYIGNDLISGQASQQWRIHHNVLHHPYTNNSTVDPDINFRNLVITQHHFDSFNKKMESHHKYQHYYVFGLFQMFPLLRHFFAFHSLLVKKKIYSYSIPKPAQFESKISAVLKAIFLMYYYAIPLWIYTQQSGFGYFTSIMLMHIPNLSGATYLGFFFLISHFFEGTHAYNNNKTNVKYKNLKQGIVEMDWAQSQIETASNVSGNILAFVNGGLNYQIPHHLFPRINSMHYPKLVGVIRKFAKENNFKHVHFDTIGENVVSTMKWFNINRWYSGFH